MSKIREIYKNKVIPNLIKKFGYSNILQVPKLEKIVLNIGVGESLENKSFLERAVSDLSMITGQKPVVTKAKKSISNFKLRAGMSIGCKVTLHGKRMYDFFDRLIHIAIPRIRDFRGLTDKSFDGKGNYTMGVKEQIIFPEIDYDKIDKLRGMNITIVTSAKTDEEGLSFLTELGMPFIRKK